MSYYLLPQTNSNGLYEDCTAPLGISLSEYLSKLTPSEESPECKNTPKSTYLIMAELFRMHNLPVKDSLHLGSHNCLEYLKYINGEHTDDEPTNTYSLVVDDTGNLDLRVISYQGLYGTYISRINESTSSEAIQFLYKLCCSYKRVYLCKPDADCAKTSTKYVVAIHYKHPPDINNLRISYYFRMKLEEINSVFGQSQLEHLRFMESKPKIMDWGLKV